VEYFVQEISLMLFVHRYPVNDWVPLLISTLRGGALTWFNQAKATGELRDLIDWDTLVGLLKERFTPHMHQFSLRHHLASLTVVRNDIMDYNRRFQELFTEVKGMQFEDMLFYYTQNIPVDMSRRVLTSNPTKPADMYAASIQSLYANSNLSSLPPPIVEPMELGAMQRPKKVMGRRFIRKDGKGRGTITIREDKETRKCFIFGKVGHLARNCSRKMAIDIIEPVCDESTVWPAKEL
jgi:hypothetical protein